MLLLWLGVAWWQPDPQPGEESKKLFSKFLKKLSSNTFFAAVYEWLKWLPGISSLEVVFSVPEAIVTMVQYTAYPIKEECVLWRENARYVVCTYDVHITYMILYMYIYIWLCKIHSKKFPSFFNCRFVRRGKGARRNIDRNTVGSIGKRGLRPKQVSFVFHHCPSLDEQLNCVSRRAWFAWWTPLANTSIHIWKSPTPRE